jgi:hypothetical protein
MVVYLAMLAAAGFVEKPFAANDTVIVSLSLFSGRLPPRAKLENPSKSDAVIAVFQASLHNGMPYSALPQMPSTPGYTGVRILPILEGVRGKTYYVRQGWIYTSSAEPCYRDSGSSVEKAAVSAAFKEDDLDYPGGPQPMTYLACSVPDSLHPESPCPTALLHRSHPLSGEKTKSAPVPHYDAAGGVLMSPEVSGKSLRIRLP